MKIPSSVLLLSNAYKRKDKAGLIVAPRERKGAYKIISFITENTLLLHYKHLPVTSLSANNHCLWENH
jgi:hypothetical protein